MTVTADPLPPRVSFVVITMNRPGDLAECLRSVQAQQAVTAEIIVVDNCSTDDTLVVLARDFPEVRVVALPENRGVSGGRNAGVQVAQGDVCIFIDDDARFPSEQAAERTLAYFDREPDLACVAFTIRESATGIEEMKSIPRRDKRRIDSDYEATYFCGAGFAVRRVPYVDLGMFWEPLVYGSQEIDLAYRFLDADWRIIHSACIEVIHKSSPTARPSGQWVYFNTRDRPWVAVRNLPWRAVASTTLLWWSNTALVALRTGHVRRWGQGIWDCLVGLGPVVKSRRLIRRKTIRELARLSGRYWY